MIADYYVRLACLCFASFFLVHAAAGVGVLLLAPAAARRAERIGARAAARMLFSLRLLPCVVASCAVAGMCVPSYLWFEPRGESEPLGAVCAAAAALGILLWVSAAVRAVAAVARTIAFGHYCRKSGRKIAVEGQPAAMLLVEWRAPLLALSGVVRPTLYLSREIFEALGPEELGAALRHEDAHRGSRDNLKRLAFLLAPEILPLGRCFARIESNWAKFSEWAADDDAAGGDQSRALWLASALVRVARMGSARQPELAASLTACGCGLEDRVNRLLRTESPCEEIRGLWSLARHGELLLAGVSTAALMLLPGALACVHGLLERLVR